MNFDDSASVDMSVIEQKKLFEMEWSEEHEKILVDWADKAMCYRWLHANANNKFSKLSRWFTIPVIIISTLTGTANFAQDRVPTDYVPLFVMMVGTLNIIAGIISTISQFLKISELNESHRVSSIAWDKFYRNIKIELAKNPKERIPVGQMVKLMKEEFDRLMETSPVIQSDVIERFNNTFKDSEHFKLIKKPEICDEMVSTDTFRFIAKEIAPEKNAKLKAAVKKANKVKETTQRIQSFSTRFLQAQSRLPTHEEVMEHVFDGNNPEDLSSDQISMYVEQYLEGAEGNIQHGAGAAFDGRGIP